MTAADTRRTAGRPVHDVVGIGIGPFNLGLACLADPLDDLDAVFLDAADGFAWHHGMMLDDATIQVPFLADLVTMADPTSPFSFLAWLKETGRLYPFYIREDFHPLRSEYDAYCRWAADRLDTLRWGRRVTAVEHDPATDCFTVHAETDQGPETYRARHVVVGIGTEPAVPAPLADLPGPVVHSAEFLPNREGLRTAGSIAVVGSGQSAAEVYRELLEDARHDGYRLDWITRSPRFFPMEDTKLTLEMTSPEYTDHFHALPEAVRDRLGREQRGLYKGISADLVDALYDQLYRLSARGPVPTSLRTETSVVDAEWLADRGTYRLTLRHEQLGETYAHEVDAPGPRDRVPPPGHGLPRPGGAPRRAGRAGSPGGRTRPPRRHPGRPHLGAERRGAHARAHRARPRHGRVAERVDPPVRHRSHRLRPGGADRLPGVRPARLGPLHGTGRYPGRAPPRRVREHAEASA